MNTDNMMEYQKAIAYISRLMREKKLVVGSKLPSERDLAEEIGIGRNSTREAISILRGMGLIESRQGSGNYISQDCAKTIKLIVSAMLTLGSISKADIVEFRKVISKTVCEFLLDYGLTPDEQRKLANLVEGMKTASRAEYAILDSEFHRSLIKASKNPLFIMIMEPIADVYLEIVPEVILNTDVLTREKLAKIHGNILKGIIEKDIQACELYIAEHYRIVDEVLSIEKENYI